MGANSEIGDSMEKDFKEFILDEIEGIKQEIYNYGDFMSNQEAVDLLCELYEEIEREYLRRDKGDTLIGLNTER